MDLTTPGERAFAYSLEASSNARRAQERIKRLEDRIEVLERILRCHEAFEWSRVHGKPVEEYYEFVPR